MKSIHDSKQAFNKRLNLLGSSNSKTSARRPKPKPAQAVPAPATPALKATPAKPKSPTINIRGTFKVLETFDGFVERVDDGVAYVTLTTSDGERLIGPYPLKELREKGVGERDRFTLRALQDGDAVRFRVEPFPRVEVTPEQLREIHEDIEQSLGGLSFDDDY